MEAELFGHERGAFTDAKESKLGLFEAAEGGFIFLDEVGDLELSLQGKLLRAIEERTVRRVGGIRDRRIDVRILAATNRNLERQVQQNLFRGDLYFRLAVILLHLPPLRERGADVALLAEHFLRRFSSKYGKGTRRIDDRARQALMAYPWPGNVRELSHVIERAVLWSRNHILTVDDLSLATPVHASGSSDGTSVVPAQETAWSCRRAGRQRPHPVGAEPDRARHARIRREPDQGGPAPGDYPGHSPIPAQEIWSSGWVISPNLAISPPPKPLPY